MHAPPAYPRIPHLAPGRGTPDDTVLDRQGLADLLDRTVVVEEKLDGANAMVWVADGVVHASGRAGPSSRDRARQFGLLRAWVAEHHDALERLLTPSTVLYGEWLVLTHTVHYGRLPDYFVGFDLWHPRDGFAAPGTTHERLHAAGVVTAPVVGRGRYTFAGLENLLESAAAWSDEPIEGIVVRAERPRTVRVAKLLRPGFAPLADADWQRGRRRNQLAPGVTGRARYGSSPTSPARSSIERSHESRSERHGADTT